MVDRNNDMFRWFAVAILLSAIGTSGYYRRRARLGSETVARCREGGFFLALRAFVALVLFLPVIAYAVMRSESGLLMLVSHLLKAAP